MSFLEDIARARALLAENRRVSLRAIQREFGLDSETLDDFVEELVDVQQVADRDGSVLVFRSEHEGVAAAAGSPSDEPVATPARPEAPVPATAPAASAGERRQLTVLFCDLVDSTRISSMLDPEDWREIVQLYQKSATAIVERFGGHVAQYLGDGILVYFGHPRAHEDDAERAVRAGLSIVRDMPSLNEALPRAGQPVMLQVRIGVHTGPVVLGTMGDHSEQLLAMGQTTNLAARLQDHARPDTVVMSTQTRRLVKGVFLTHDLGTRELKGIDEPVHIIEVESVSGVRSRIELLAVEGLTPLVGREQELGLLDDRFEQAADGYGQAVLINGEAGIGKSRIVQAFQERLGERPHSWLECRCSPYTQDSAFHPMLELLRGALVQRPELDLDNRIAAIENGLRTADFDLAACVPLMTDALGLPLPERYEPLTLAPEGRRKKLINLLVEWVLRLARSQPLVMLIEDLHWIDPSSRELFGELLDQMPRSHVLVLATHRPDFESTWPAKGHMTPMQLSRMTRAQLADLVRKSAKDRVLPEEWLDQIIRRSDGVPLFAEELTRTVLETNPDVDPRGEVPTLHIPETLQDSLMARLDALGPVKELAQLGAVLGREFDYTSLLQISPLVAEALSSALDDAVKEELFYQRGTPPDARYVFKHALIRDAAYQSLVRSQRQRYHLRVAEALIARTPAIVEEQPERVAHHLTEAGESERAIALWQAAGRIAAANSSHGEAILHLRKALRLLEELPHDTDALELRIYVALSASVMSAFGHTSEEMLEITDRLEELIKVLPEELSAFIALWRIANVTTSSKSTEAGYLQAGRVYEAGTQAGEYLLIQAGIFTQAHAIALGGQATQIPDLLSRLRPFDLALDRQASLELGVSPSSMALQWGAWPTWALGFPTQAAVLLDQAIDQARQVGQLHPLAMVLCMGVILPLGSRQWDVLSRQAGEAHDIARENGFPFIENITRIVAVYLRAQSGEPDVAAVASAMQGAGATGNRGGLAVILWAGAEVHRLGGEPDGALRMIDTAFAAAHPLGQHHWDAELHRLRGEILASEKGDAEAGETCFREALDIARGQGARMLELRAATSFARLLRDAGRSAEAQALLGPVYEWFTEGHELPDLVDAKTLLAELD